MNKGILVAAVSCVTFFVALIAGAGIDRGGISRGALLDDNDITVNGIAYEEAVAVVFIDGERMAGASALRGGQIVTVRGSVNEDGTSGTARIVTYDDNVEAPIDYVDPWDEEGLVEILGQKVRITSDTRFDPAIYPQSVLGLHEGLHIEVSGLPGENEEVDATWIGLPRSTPRFEATASVKNVDTSKRELTMTDLVVDYSAAAVIGFPDGHPVDYDRVEVRGYSMGSDGELRASLLIKKPLLSGAEGVNASLDGYVSMFDSLDYFEIDGTPVRVDNETDFDGVSAGQISMGMRLRIDGHFDAAGLVLAASVERVN